jgi:c-di-GMP-binding flagellar brake protein YcgR
MKERRRHPRFNASYAALFFTDTYTKPKVATLFDLGLGGIRIQTPYSLCSGESLEISFAIHPQIIRCRGRVVHVLWRSIEDVMAGIRFEVLSEQDRLYLEKHIYSLERKPVTENRRT